MANKRKIIFIVFFHWILYLWWANGECAPGSNELRLETLKLNGAHTHEYSVFSRAQILRRFGFYYAITTQENMSRLCNEIIIWCAKWAPDVVLVASAFTVTDDDDTLIVHFLLPQCFDFLLVAFCRRIALLSIFQLFFDRLHIDFDNWIIFGRQPRDKQNEIHCFNYKFSRLQNWCFVLPFWINWMPILMKCLLRKKYEIFSDSRSCIYF